MRGRSALGASFLVSTGTAAAGLESLGFSAARSGSAAKMEAVRISFMGADLYGHITEMRAMTGMMVA
jgi:hypothetical protein